MKTRFSAALAHYSQLRELGCDQDQALADTQVAYDLDDLTLDILGQAADLVDLDQV